MQFEIFDHSSNINIERFKGQFKNFQNEKCKLPCFSANIFKADESFLSTLNVVKVIGEYSFYEKTDEGYWISFHSTYLNLSDDCETVNIYVSDNIKFDGVFECGYLTMMAYKYILIKNNAFMIHSAAVINEDHGILFCGNSGAGKSTQADLWKKYLNSTPLNYDKPCIINDNGKYIVHGSPWSGKEGLWKNENKPVKAIVFVKQAKENKAYKIPSAQAFSYLYLNNYVFPFSEEWEQEYISVIKNAAENIPVYILECDISENAVKTLYEEIYDKDYI